MREGNAKEETGRRRWSQRRGATTGADAEISMVPEKEIKNFTVRNEKRGIQGFVLALLLVIICFPNCHCQLWDADEEAAHHQTSRVWWHLVMSYSPFIPSKTNKIPQTLLMQSSNDRFILLSFPNFGQMHIVFLCICVIFYWHTLNTQCSKNRHAAKHEHKSYLRLWAIWVFHWDLSVPRSDGVSHIPALNWSLKLDMHNN